MGFLTEMQMAALVPGHVALFLFLCFSSCQRSSYILIYNQFLLPDSFSFLGNSRCILRAITKFKGIVQLLEHASKTANLAFYELRLPEGFFSLFPRCRRCESLSPFPRMTGGNETTAHIKPLSVQGFPSGSGSLFCITDLRCVLHLCSSHGSDLSKKITQ